MRLTAILLLAACIQVSAHGYGQNITLSAKDTPLEQVLNQIKRQTGLSFLWDQQLLKGARPVTVDIKNASLEQALEACLRGQGLTYSIMQNLVVIKPQVQQQANEAPMPAGDIHGRITDSAGRPLVGVTVQVRGTNKVAVTNEKGEFSLSGIDEHAMLIISHIGFERREYKLSGQTEINLSLKISAQELGNAEVTYSTGYQNIPKERSTGSFVFIDSALINRKVSTNIMDRLDGITSGLSFNNNLKLSTGAVLQPNQSIFTIRGRSTINSNPNPLIILDNFPYDGDLSTINPDDVESITVLKDAAAAAIWGAFSGNGVIVITSKKGRYSQALNVIVNASVNVGDKPNLYYQPQMSSSDYIDVEEFLYGKGFYTNLGSAYSLISPVVQILYNKSKGLITAADSASQIDALRKVDTRRDLNKYFYQKMVNQHYDVSLNGGGSDNKYFVSAGFDNNQPNLSYNGYQRVTIDANNTYSLLKHKLEIVTGIQFQQNYNANNNSGNINSLFPYLKLADANGNALAAPNVSGYRQSYLDTVGQGKLLDWNYRPLDDLRNAHNVTKLTDYHLNLGIKYKIIPGLDIDVKYQYSKGLSLQENYQSQLLWSTRNLINSFTQISLAGVVTRPVPPGGILDRTNNTYQSHNIRGQLTYTNTWKHVHAVNAIAGAEVKAIDNFVYSYRLYGYAPATTTSVNVDYVGYYPKYGVGGTSQITNNITNLGTTNNFISYYGLVGYTYNDRYSLTVSGRKDESNIFGVSTNKKGVPLYSAGVAWNLSKEGFYKIDWLPFLKLRLTDGYQGNYNSSVAALTTISYGTNNSYGAVQASVSNLPNPALRWEKINQINAGVDFASKKDRLSGSLEYFVKKGTDLIAPAPLDPTTGTTTLTVNSADMRTRGLDIVLNSRNISTRNFQWNSTLLFSYALDKITAYLVPPSSVGAYLSTNVINPVIGKPMYSLYAYRFAGLDSAGNPKGILDGKVSENYSGFSTSTNFSNLRYMGPVNPPFTGSLRNTLTWKQLSFSFLIKYELGFYFRRPSIGYGNLFLNTGGTATGNGDYEKRWQKPGDELKTSVPSMIYTGYNNGRDGFYNSSDVLVDKGDNIRLQDLQLAYDLNRRQIRSLPLKAVQFYIYANNIGILWKANHNGIDPDFQPGYSGLVYPNPRAYAFGLKASF